MTKESDSSQVLPQQDNQLSPLNRQGRRNIRYNSETERQYASLYNRITTINGVMHEANTQYNNALDAAPDNYSTALYHQPPFIRDFLVVRKQLHDFRFEHDRYLTLPNAQDIINPAEAKSKDLFEIKAHGVSLHDIEHMGYPLSPTERDQITAIYTSWGLWKTLFPNFNKQDQEREQTIGHAALQLATSHYLPGQVAKRHDSSLIPLEERLLDYFDYYTSLLLNAPPLSSHEEELLIWERKTVKWAPRIHAGYTPARLGITPSSTVKLFDQRSAISDVLVKFAFQKLSERVAQFIGDAYVPGALPTNLSQYQHYDKYKDAEASSILSQHYKKKSRKPAETIQAGDDTLKQFGKAQKLLYADIAKIQEKQIGFSLPEGQPISDVVVTAQNRDVVMLIARFRDPGVHITLEIERVKTIGETGRVYGMPSQLLNNGEVVSQQVLTEVLTPILEELTMRHPELRPKSTGPIYVRDLPTKPSEKVSIPIHPERRSEKRKHKSQQPVQNPDTTIRETIQPPQRQRVLAVRAEDIEALLAKRIKRPKPEVVEQVMQSLSTFQYHWGDAKQIKWSSGEGVTVRVGDYRAIVKLDGNNITLVDVGDRKSIYRKYSDNL